MVRTMRSSSLLMRRCTSSRRRSNTSSSFRSPQVGQCLNRRNLSSTSPNNGSPAAVRANVLCGMSETLSKKSLLSGGWKRAQRRPPSFSLSAWTFDSGRRTFIDIQTSEQRPFQGAENQRHKSPVKKVSSFSICHKSWYRAPPYISNAAEDGDARSFRMGKAMLRSLEICDRPRGDRAVASVGPRVCQCC